MLNYYFNQITTLHFFYSFSYILCLLCSSYAKAYDPDNWFIIDKETAEIKLIKEPDRESPFLVNGTYIAKILAISQGNTDWLYFIILQVCCQ